MEQYPDMVYGFCLIRTIHYVVALRQDFPNERILISKFDFSDAYRRISLFRLAVVQTILIVQSIAFVPLLEVILRGIRQSTHLVLVLRNCYRLKQLMRCH